jgi:lysophospholipase L1-like esterase
MRMAGWTPEVAPLREVSRRRSLRLIVPIAIAVLVAAGIAGWFASRPQVETTHATGRARVAFLGNSFVGGSLMDSGLDATWPALVSRNLDLADSIITADGSGYVTPGAGGARFSTLAKRVPGDADGVVILGSDDDQTHSQESIEAAARQTIQIVKKAAPHAKILVIATFWVSNDPPAGIIASRDAVRAAAKAEGVSFADPIAGRWLGDDPGRYIGSDGLHPVDAGEAVLAKHIQPLVADLVGVTG